MEGKGKQKNKQINFSCVRKGPFPSASLQASVCFYVVRSLKKRTLKICTFCPVSSIKKRSFNLLCVLDLTQVNEYEFPSRD